METDTTSEHEARVALDLNPFPDSPVVQIRDDGIAIATSYSEALHRLLRWVPKARWRAAERCWLVPFSGAEAVRAILPEITRLAEATRELEEPVPREAATEAKTLDLVEAFLAGARLLHGSEWRAVLMREGAVSIDDWIDGRTMPDASDPVFADLVAALRQRAAATAKAADRLDSARSEAMGKPGRTP
jgi:hypothetical protein